MAKLKNKKHIVKIILKNFIRLLLVSCLILGGFKLYKSYFETTKTIETMDKLIKEIDTPFVKKVGFDSNNVVSAEKADVVSKEINSEEKIENSELVMEDDCLAVEKVLLSKLNKEDSKDFWDHSANKAIYEKLYQFGCSDNQLKYQNKIRLEEKVMNAVDNREYADTDSLLCETRERILHESMKSGESVNPEDHIYNAKLYDIMERYGCESRQDSVRKLREEELKTAQMLEEIEANMNQNMNFE